MQYRVSLQDALRDAAPAKIAGRRRARLHRAFMAVERDDRAADFLAKLAPILEKAGSTSFVGCSTSQQGALNTARSNGTSMSSNSVSYLDSHTSANAGPRYTTWFGTPSSSNYSSVSNNFDAILSAFQNAAMQFDCSTCNINAYAYVYSNQPYRIYLCSVFWSAPATGTDSKAGTLVHETSHFNVVAGTNDNAYGQTACKKLADIPARRRHATARYFAENPRRIKNGSVRHQGPTRGTPGADRAPAGRRAPRWCCARAAPTLADIPWSRRPLAAPGVPYLARRPRHTWYPTLPRPAGGHEPWLSSPAAASRSWCWRSSRGVPANGCSSAASPGRLLTSSTAVRHRAYGGIVASRRPPRSAGDAGDYPGSLASRRIPRRATPDPHVPGTGERAPPSVADCSEARVARILARHAIADDELLRRARSRRLTAETARDGALFAVADDGERPSLPRRPPECSRAASTRFTRLPSAKTTTSRGAAGSASCLPTIRALAGRPAPLLHRHSLDADRCATGRRADMLCRLPRLAKRRRGTTA